MKSWNPDCYYYIPDGNGGIMIKRNCCMLILILLSFTLVLGCTSSPSQNAVNTIDNNIDSSMIALVKNGTLSNYPNQAIGVAVDNFMSNAAWSTFRNKEGNLYVVAAGGITYHQQESVAQLIFRILNNNSFQCCDLFVNGEQKNDLNLFLDAMFSSASANQEAIPQENTMQNPNNGQLQMDYMNEQYRQMIEEQNQKRMEEAQENIDRVNEMLEQSYIDKFKY